MRLLRDGVTAINSRINKLERSDPTAPAAGIAVVCVAAGVSVGGIGWQLAFAFLGGAMAATALFAHLDSYRWEKVHLNLRKLQDGRDELIRLAEAKGYLEAVRDIRQAASDGGEQ